MNPSFEQIAQLFAMPVPETGNSESTPSLKEGRNTDESLQLGRSSLNDGNFERAIEHFKKAIEQRGDEDTADILTELAGAYEYADLAPQAFRQYAKAVKARQDVEPIVGISDLYRRYGRYREAIEQLEGAIKVDPKNPFLNMKLAETFRDLGERRRALAAAQSAVEIKPDEAFYHYWIGDLLIEMERFQEALESLRAAIELSPGDDYMYQRAAVAFWREDRKPEAIKAIRLASDLDPDKNIYHGLLEALLDEMGQTDEANQESERADKMDQYDHDMLSRLLKEMKIEEAS